MRQSKGRVIFIKRLKNNNHLEDVDDRKYDKTIEGISEQSDMENKWPERKDSRVEAGSNTSTAAPRDVKGDVRGTTRSFGL
jgi:hypothetical protein